MRTYVILITLLFSGSAYSQNIEWDEDNAEQKIHHGTAYAQGAHCSNSCPVAQQRAQSACNARGMNASSSCSCPNSTSDDGKAVAPFSCNQK